MSQDQQSATPDAENTRPVLLWLRRDLRLGDHPALAAALASERPIAAVFVLDDEAAGAWALGGASRWWLHQSLTAFSREWTARGGAPVILRKGSARDIIPALAEELDAADVLWTRSYEPFAVDRDAAIKSALKDAGRSPESVKGALLFEPWEIKTGAGDPYRVFTPFWRACRTQGLPTDVIDAPTAIPGWTGDVASDTLTDWSLEPTKPDWSGGLREAWTPGEAAAVDRLRDFLRDDLATYAEDRDFPAKPATSRLSPHLHWGEISPRQVTAATLGYADAHGLHDAADKFLSEIGWREFSNALLFHNRELPSANLQTKFDRFAWRRDEEALEAWRRGLTGYPVVDAGMRELWTTGWMHNRVRMIVGSFLVKHLLLHWREGEDWFWDTLVDADLANNAAGWQWIAGTGADAAPYFRVFNPVTQGERYDPQGDYVRRWVPELAELPAKVLHKPWEAPEPVLTRAGVRLGETYPHPIVEHKAARARALAAFEALKTPA